MAKRGSSTAGPGSTGTTGTADALVTERAAELRALIDYHNERYHTLDAPETPDADFDALVRALPALAAADPALGTP